MLTVGITGGIGSGKTTVCKVFEALGIDVYYADEQAKALYTEDTDVKKQVIELFGVDVYTQNGELNRTKLANAVFSDKHKLEALNAIIHPAVVKRFENWQKDRTCAYLLKEAAILFESGTNKGVDKVITVTAPLQLKIDRVVRREGITEEKVRDRMKNQWTDDEKIKLSDFVIYNDEQQLLIPQVLKVHQQLLQYSKNK